MDNPLEEALGEEPGVEEPAAPEEAPAPAPAPEPEPPPQEEPFAAALYAQNLRISRRFAEREHGADTVAAVHDWAVQRCDADAAFNAQMRSSDDPYGAAFAAYHREQIAAKVTPERLAAFEAWERAQAALAGHAPTQAQPPAQPTPPRSLAEVPGTGLRGQAVTDVAEGAAFGAAFPS